MRSPIVLGVASPEKLVFKDFEEDGSTQSIMDFRNSFCVLTLCPNDPNDPSFRHMVRIMQNGGGLYRVSEYFCMKSIGNGVSMTHAVATYWQTMPEKEKSECIAEFTRRYANGWDKLFTETVRAIDRHVSRANVVLKSIVFPEDGESADERIVGLVDSLLSEVSSIESLIRAVSASEKTKNILDSRPASNQKFRIKRA